MKPIAIIYKKVDACLKNNRLDMLKQLVKKAKLSYCQINVQTETAFCIETKELFYIEHNGGTYPTKWNLIKD